MGRVIDEGNVWKLEIFPEAHPVQEINEVAEKGYRALLGLDPVNNRHVIMYVWYNKDKYPIGEVLNKINDMRECPRCDTLDRERLNNISIETPAQQPGWNPAGPPGMGYGYVATHRYNPQAPEGMYSSTPSQPAPKPEVSKNVKDMFAGAIFDAYLTPAGKMLMGNVFGDETLTEEAFPKTPDEMARLWEDTTAGKFLRSPDEAKEFISVIRDENENNDTGVAGVSKTNDKTKKFSQGIVIF